MPEETGREINQGSTYRSATEHKDFVSMNFVESLLIQLVLQIIQDD